VVVPLFFILSGFTLAVVYGDTVWCAGSSCGDCCTGSLATAEGNNKGKALISSSSSSSLSSSREGSFVAFLQNRAARLLPMYYLCSALGVPLLLSGFTKVPPTEACEVGAVVTSFTLTSTLLVVSDYGWNVDGPAWFVATLVWFYILFPCFMRMARTRWGCWWWWWWW
jgi:peptidoglycan/LPS O-acetylase OafA/YrhL